jgi:hypothetical protein
MRYDLGRSTGVLVSFLEKEKLVKDKLILSLRYKNGKGTVFGVSFSAVAWDFWVLECFWNESTFVQG